MSIRAHQSTCRFSPADMRISTLWATCWLPIYGTYLAYYNMRVCVVQYINAIVVFLSLDTWEAVSRKIKGENRPGRGRRDACISTISSNTPNHAIYLLLQLSSQELLLLFFGYASRIIIPTCNNYSGLMVQLKLR